MLNSVDAVADATAGVVDDAAHDAAAGVVDAAADALDALFSFLMHLVVICSSISHMIARLLVVSVSIAFAFCAHFCS